MKNSLIAACLAGLTCMAAPSAANTVMDAQGDWAPGYTGALLADLDVKSFTVGYEEGTSTFHISATMWGDIVPGSEGFYVIGINTGTGVAHPFGPLGQPNVKFNTVFLIQKTGTGNLGGNVLDPFITISGDTFWIDLPLAVIPPSTGFTPRQYGFNLWPRGSGAQAVSDFAPENSMLSSVPEIGSWAMMIIGLAGVGGMLRTKRRTAAFA